MLSKIVAGNILFFFLLLFLQRKKDLAFHLNLLLGRKFPLNAWHYFLKKKKKKRETHAPQFTYLSKTAIA